MLRNRKILNECRLSVQIIQNFKAKSNVLPTTKIGHRNKAQYRTIQFKDYDHPQVLLYSKPTEAVMQNITFTVEYTSGTAHTVLSRTLRAYIGVIFSHHVWHRRAVVLTDDDPLLVIPSLLIVLQAQYLST